MTPVYLDNHATTRVDPRVVEAMLPFFTEEYGNPASTNHALGWAAKDAVELAREQIAGAIGANAREIVFTSGATESNNLAIRGMAERPRLRGKRLVTVASEHKSVLEPIARLGRHGFEVVTVPITQSPHARAGLVDLDQLAAAITDETLLVSVMLANNEIGVIQPLAAIGEICRQRGVALHCDATQALGKIPIDVAAFHVDLLSCCAHKLYGPKGVGALYVRRSQPHLRLEQQIAGGGHERGLRSGTLNVPGIVGFARAIGLCLSEMPAEQERLAGLRDRLFEALSTAIEGVTLNGPALDQFGLRLAGNLNVGFAAVDGEALIMNIKDLAVSSGSACTSANPEPSHVLRALGLDDDATRSSLRFGLGRFNSDSDVDFAVESVASAVELLRRLGSSA